MSLYRCRIFKCGFLTNWKTEIVEINPDGGLPFQGDGLAEGNARENALLFINHELEDGKLISICETSSGLHGENDFVVSVYYRE
jgi:hypothetical protein